MKLQKFPLFLFIILSFIVSQSSALDLLEVSQNLNIKKSEASVQIFAHLPLAKREILHEEATPIEWLATKAISTPTTLAKAKS